MPSALSKILDTTSYSALDDQSRKDIHTFFATKLHPHHLLLDIRQIFAKRQALLASADFYSERLDQINPASFRFLSQVQRWALIRELMFTFYVLSAQYQLDEAEARRQNLKKLRERLKKCSDFIEELQIRIQYPHAALTIAVRRSDKPVKYLGLTVLAPFLVEKMMEVVDAPGKTHVMRNWLNTINGRRLYWVWGSNLLNTIISMLAEDFTNKGQAQAGMGIPAPAAGYISWVLYYVRFGINLFLLLKHTIKGPWMSEQERSMPTWERFKTQWDQRKFALLNDSIWGLANMVCFFWLTGSGMFGYYGNVVTAGLLVMDVCLTIWRFYEESTAYNAQMQRYKRDIITLDEKIAQNLQEQEYAANAMAENLKQAAELLQSLKEEEELLKAELSALQDAQQQCEFNWRYKKYNTINELVYAVALLSAFSLMCCFLFPPAMVAPAAVMIMGVLGAVLCFAFTMISTAITGALELYKSKESAKLAREKCEKLREDFKQASHQDVKKQLFLEIKRLSIEADYQEKMAEFQKIKLIRSIVMDVIIPPLIFASLLFMPMGIGIAVIAAGLLLALATHLLLKRLEPPKPPLPEFDEQEYKEFAKTYHSDESPATGVKGGIFAAPKPEESMAPGTNKFTPKTA
jgi:hypothetical protein